MPVQFETHDHVAILSLDRPEARNAVNGALADALEAALDQYEADENLWVAILRSTGPVFCAGADLKEVAAGNGRALFTERGGFAGLVKRARTKPIIAAVNGAAVAGGCELVLACDMVVAADNARFGLPEVKRSLAATAGGMFRLPRAVGMAAAMEMILTGDPIDAPRAYELGLVNQVVPEDDLLEAAKTLAGRITANAPLAVQESRNVAARALMDDDDALWAAGEEAIRRIAKTEDYKEGPRAFIEKRDPVWKAK